MKTYSAKIRDIKRNWYLLDAKNKIMGRVATQAAVILRGKHKPNFTPNQDMGDFVVIINAKDIKLTGKKREQKEYIRHTGYPGGIRKEELKDLLRSKPTKPLKKAVLGMLPANHFKSIQARRLKIYQKDKHRHKQKLINLKI